MDKTVLNPTRRRWSFEVFETTRNQTYLHFEEMLLEKASFC